MRDLFQTLPVDTTVEKSRYEVFTQSELTTDPLQIKIDPTRRWVDLSKTLFVYTVEFVANDNTTLLLAANKVAPINLIGHSLIKQFDVSFNKQLVTTGIADYHYTAYFDRLLKYSGAEKKELLTLEGWYTDTSNKFDDTDPLPRPIVIPTGNTAANVLAAMTAAENRATPNAGAAGRHGLCCQNRRVTFVISPVVSVFDQVRYLTPGTQIDFRVRWNSAALVMMSGDTTVTQPKYKIVPQSPEIWIYHVEANPQLHLQNEAAMLQNQQIALYPFSEKRIVAHTINNGRRREKFSNVFTGFRPNYMMVGLVRGDAYAGNYVRNPFNFHDLHQKQIKVTLDGEELPYPPIVLNSHDKCEGYATLANFAGKLFDFQSIGISREDYKDGNYLLLWNFNPDGALNAGYVYGRNVGNVSIEIEFSQDTANNTTLIVAGEFEQIDVVARYPPNRGDHRNYTYVRTRAADQALAELGRLQETPEREWGMVFNVDPADRPGQHWLALYSPAGDPAVECLDSFGTATASRYPGAPDARALLRRVRPVTAPRLQSNDTYACGHYCLAYLYARTHGKTPRRFLDAFSPTEHAANAPCPPLNPLSRMAFVTNGATASIWRSRRALANRLLTLLRTSFLALFCPALTNSPTSRFFTFPPATAPVKSFARFTMLALCFRCSFPLPPVSLTFI
ncbi:hypothetical protein QZH41_005717 [Actinostola sp. cb2023]|nr:hypothetical protein QZH41_005717 [Actinostola sp. cb2023]